MQQSKIYQERRDEVCRGLDKLGWTYEKPRASMFVWAKINPDHYKAGEGTIDFCLRMMDEAEVALAPAAPSASTAKDSSASPWSKTNSASARPCGTWNAHLFPGPRKPSDKQ